MVSAVKSADLTIPKYNNMMLLMQREPALRKKVIGHGAAPGCRRRLCGRDVRRGAGTCLSRTAVAPSPPGCYLLGVNPAEDAWCAGRQYRTRSRSGHGND
jgi:hypothetical protein